MDYELTDTHKLIRDTARRMRLQDQKRIAGIGQREEGDRQECAVERHRQWRTLDRRGSRRAGDQCRRTGGPAIPVWTRSRAATRLVLLPSNFECATFHDPRAVVTEPAPPTAADSC